MEKLKRYLVLYEDEGFIGWQSRPFKNLEVAESFAKEVEGVIYERLVHYRDSLTRWQSLNY